MKEKAYHEKVNVKNEVKLRRLLDELPAFCRQFARSLPDCRALSPDIGKWRKKFRHRRQFPFLSLRSGERRGYSQHNSAAGRFSLFY